ncbi:MAG TPA: amidohydrolase [Xanthomonadaceae bacterium]|nr:amidohydrolase [Xanthomonadaceae bacterium]
MQGMRFVMAAALAMAPATAAVAAEAVTVVTAAKIRTMDPAQPVAGAMAFDDAGEVLAVGVAGELFARWPDARRLDLGDATVVPGLIDAHGHVAGLGLSRMRVELEGTRDKAEVLERLRAFEATLGPGEWLLGRGWDQNDWPEQVFPTAADLDAAFPDRPVWLARIDGHAGWANSAALRAIGQPLDASGARGDWQPAGGRIIRDAQGRATGVLVDGAMALVDAVLPAMDLAAAERALALGMQEAARHGLTGVHDAGVSLLQMEAYRNLADRGEMPVRIHAMADGDAAALAWLCEEGPYHHPGGRLQMRAVKLYVDGALGSRGAALLEDYSDDPGNRGLVLMSPDALGAAVARARDCGIQVATHAIGDRGNRLVLDAYAGALEGHPGLRWRIEHAQVLAPEDLPRLAQLGVIASMQPTHATSDMPWAGDRLGPERIHGAYAWRSLRDSGARLALGSDFPVESVDPRLGLFAAATRTNAAGDPVGGWLPGELLTPFEALRGFTRDAAWAGFAEGETGTLGRGMRADFVVLAEDPLGIPASGLDDLTVLSTWVDGKAVYTRP